MGLQEAIKEYQKVVDGYPEQNSEVAIARDKIIQLEKIKTKTGFETSKELTITKLDIEPDGTGEISPDGKYLSHVDWVTGDLAITEIKTGVIKRLTKNKYKDYEYKDMAWNSRWSPDGKQIAYDWVIDGDYEVRIIGLENLTPETIYQGSRQIESLRLEKWTSDGNSLLVYIKNKDESLELILVSVKDKSESSLIKKHDNILTHPSFSPDGRFLVYSLRPRNKPIKSDIFIYDLKTNIENNLTNHPSGDKPLCWSLDGKNFVFLSDPSGKYDMWSIQIDDNKMAGEPKLINMDVGGIFPLGVSHKGQLFYSKHKFVRDIYTAKRDDISGKTVSPVKKVLARYEGSNSSPAYSPEGNFLAYSSIRSGSAAENRKYAFCIKNLITQEEREIFPKLLSFLNPCWASDSKSLFVSGVNNDRQSGIFNFNAQSGETDAIILFEKSVFISEVESSLDGKFVYYLLQDIRNRSKKIMRLNLKTKKETEINQAGQTFGSKFTLSPDGKSFAFISRGKEQIINIFSFNDKKTRKLFAFENPYLTVIKWTPDGKYIICPIKSSDDESKYNLYLISVDTGEYQKLDWQFSRIISLSVHRDCNQIAFGSTGSISEAFVIDNFLPK